MRSATGILALSLVLPGSGLFAQSARNVLVVVNDRSAESRAIGDYYALRRSLPPRNLCHINTPPTEAIERTAFDETVAAPIATCLKRNKLVNSVLYIVTTLGVPLKIPGTDGLGGTASSVDSELTLLYSDIVGGKHSIPGSIPNPLFGRTTAQFEHRTFPIYLVTRLAGYTVDDVKGIIDRSLRAENRGKFVIDLAGNKPPGDTWLLDAAKQLPPDRVVLDDSSKVLYGERDVIGYASWGSNDKNRHQRSPNFEWLPGAIMTEFVSSNGRTFKQPPESWNISDWSSPHLWWDGSPQTLTADYIHEGATGASGHVYEPYLTMTPRPDILLPAYYKGRNLAESYYLSIPRLSWQNIVVGDPLCVLKTP
jgi:uncharacterized protein (TIGR03790 family)